MTTPQINLNVAVKCDKKCIEICDITDYDAHYGKDVDVSRNLIIYDCDNKIVSENFGTDEYCINLAGVFFEGAEIQIGINEFIFTYIVKASDIVVPSGDLTQEQANTFTYQNILNALYALIVNELCDDETYIEVSNICETDCGLRITSRLPGVTLKVTGLVVNEDKCMTATNITDAQVSYSLETGKFYKHVESNTVYIANITGNFANSGATQFPLIPDLTGIACPYLYLDNITNPPSVDIVTISQATPNLMANSCYIQPITEDNIYTVRTDVLVTVPALYKQKIDITSSFADLSSIVFQPPTVGLPLSSFIAYTGSTKKQTANEAADNYNRMVELSNIVSSKTWAVREGNSVVFYFDKGVIDENGYGLANINFIVIPNGTAMANTNPAEVVPEYTKCLLGYTVFPVLCNLLAVIKSLILKESCNNGCSGKDGMNAMALKSRYDAIMSFLCDGKVVEACKILKETYALGIMKNNKCFSC